MKNRIIHHIEISHTLSHLSGGEKALLEIIKYFSKKGIEKQVIYTSESGKKVYKGLLGNIKNIEYSIIGLEKTEKINPYLAYYLRCFQVLFKAKKLDDRYENIIFSHEEFLPTTIFSWLLKRKNPTAKWITFFHMKAPSAFYGYIGEYTRKHKNLIPNIFILRYQFEQYIYYKMSQKVDLVLTVNPIYKDFLEKKFKKNKVYVIKKYSGIDIPNTAEIEKEYDLAFMGRFHPQKGLFEIFNIINQLKENKPDIKIVVLGGGNDGIEKEFKQKIVDQNLEDNIFYKGFITGDEKYEYIKSAKIFLFPSYYESFGQAGLEAMKLGLPVVAYDLPPFCVFEDKMIKVPILDNIKIVHEIEKLRENNTYYEKIKSEGVDYANTFSWEKTGEEIYNIIIN